MSFAQIKLKATSNEEIKEEIKKELNDLDNEELTNLKWLLLIRKIQNNKLNEKKGKRKERENSPIKVEKEKNSTPNFTTNEKDKEIKGNELNKTLNSKSNKKNSPKNKEKIEDENNEILEIEKINEKPDKIKIQINTNLVGKKRGRKSKNSSIDLSSNEKETKNTSINNSQNSNNMEIQPPIELK
jgi:hypothetical protein